VVEMRVVAEEEEEEEEEEKRRKDKTRGFILSGIRN